MLARSGANMKQQKKIPKSIKFSIGVFSFFAVSLWPLPLLAVELDAVEAPLPGFYVDEVEGVLVFLGLGLSVIFIAVLLLAIFRLKSVLGQSIAELRVSEEQLSEAQSVAHMGSWSRNFDDGTCFWSKEAQLVLELESHHQPFKHYESLVRSDYAEELMTKVAATCAQGGKYTAEHPVKCPSGCEKWIYLVGKVFLGNDGTPLHETGTIQDITERKTAEEALKQSEEQLRSILEAAPYPIMIFELGDELAMKFANASTYHLFQIDAAELEDNVAAIQDFWVHEEGRSALLEVLYQGNVFNQEVQMKTYNDKSFWAMLSATRMEFNGSNALFVSVQDVTEHKQAQDELKRLATTDPLTGILNRRSLFESAEKELHRAVRYQYPFTLMMLDLDHFKLVNDNYGHEFGDKVLQRFIEVCKGNLREEDIFGRFGGEEFVIVLTASNCEGGFLVAERIRQQWEADYQVVKGKNVSSTVSIGVAGLVEQQETVDSVLERADAMLYQAKGGGRNCTSVSGRA